MFFSIVIFFSHSFTEIPQSAAIGDLLIELNHAENVCLAGYNGDAYEYLATTFGRAVAWGTKFIHCSSQFNALKAWSTDSMKNNCGPSFGSLAKMVQDLKDGQQELNASIVEVRQTVERADCLELIHEAGRIKTGAPFPSTRAAEEFMEAEENLEVLKQVFSKSPAVLSSLERNVERRREKKQPVLDTFLVVNYTFTRAAVQELGSIEHFR